jgi:hypothetical protein
VLANVESTKGIAEIINFIIEFGMLEKRDSIQPALKKMVPAHKVSDTAEIHSSRSL